MNRTVNLTKRVQTSGGLRYGPVVLAANGRVRADLVLIHGQEERHPEGAYYLEWWEGARRVRLSVGKDGADASARRLQKEAELNAVNHGVAVSQNGNTNGPRSVAVAVTEFLDETKLTKKPKTHAAYSTALKYFQECCPKLNLHDIERKDVLKLRVGQQALQGSHPAPSACLRCLHDTHLESANVAVDGPPLDGVPFRRFA